MGFNRNRNRSESFLQRTRIACYSVMPRTKGQWESFLVWKFHMESYVWKYLKACTFFVLCKLLVDEFCCLRWLFTEVTKINQIKLFQLLRVASKSCGPYRHVVIADLYSVLSQEHVSYSFLWIEGQNARWGAVEKVRSDGPRWGNKTYGTPVFWQHEKIS